MCLNVSCVLLVRCVSACHVYFKQRVSRMCGTVRAGANKKKLLESGIAQTLSEIEEAFCSLEGASAWKYCVCDLGVGLC